MAPRRRSAGVSAVIGTAVAVMIFFTVMIPMWLYIQQLQTIFMDEVSRRLQFEVEKLNEELEITLTMQPPEINPFQKRALYLIMMNKGPIEIYVPTLYIESSRLGLQTLKRDFKMPPGALVMTPLNYYVEAGEEVMLRAPTLRGNSFTSGEPIGPNKLPFILMVQLSNTTLGHLYEVEVSVLKHDVNVNMTRGCVSLRNEEFAGGCRESARSARFVSRVEDLTDVFAFNVAPGVYEVRAYQCRYIGGESCANVSPTPVRVSVNSHAVVQIAVSPRLEISKPIPLQLAVLQQNMMSMLEWDDVEVGVTIPYIVTLGNVTEPLRNIQLAFEVLSYDDITLAPLSMSASVTALAPGSSYLGSFTLVVQDPGTDRKDYGGYFEYRVRVLSAVGAITRSIYNEADLLQPESEGRVFICKWWREDDIIRTSCRGPSTS